MVWWLRAFGIPHLNVRSFVFFRALLGFALLLLLLLYDPILPVPLDRQYAYSPIAAATWVRTLAASETEMSWLQFMACAGAVLFALGIMARPAYAMVVSVLTLHVVMVLLRRGWVHDWILPLTTLWALLVVPWSDAPSLARMITHWKDAANEEPASRAHGFAVWLPGLTLGLAFAAAAYAKLHRSGLAWITNGTVKYHFVEDAALAPGDLGLWVAIHPRLAVAFSLIAVMIEALFILVVFVRSWQMRAFFGLMGAGLMIGFYLFQGVAWWPWWIFFFAFLPWNRHGGVETGRDVTWAGAIVVPVLIASQMWASYYNLEIEPFISHYPMYANTYDSPEDYDSNHNRIRFEAEGRDVTDRVGEADGESVLLALVQHRDGEPAVSPADIVKFVSRYTRLYGPPPAVIDVLAEPRFDWQRGKFLSPRPLGTVRLRPAV